MTPHETLEKIRAALACGRSGCNCAKGNLHCPAHDDPGPSLAPKISGGKLLLHCHAGCPQDRVLDALRERGLWESAAPAYATTSTSCTCEDFAFRGRQCKHIRALLKAQAPGGRRIIATYPYRDAAGELLFEVVRFAPKDFRQRRPLGRGWDWNLDGVQRVLYRLPELLAADALAPVLVVEGEKDADAAIAAGSVATSTPAGAGKAHLCDLEPLRGRTVVIVPDQDPPGLRHADDLARLLLPFAASLRRYDLPGGMKDISELLDSGVTGADLRQDIEEHAVVVEVPAVGQVGQAGDSAASPAVGQAVGQSTQVANRTLLPWLTPSEVMEMAPDEPDYVIRGVLVKGAVTEFDAKIKVGKTTLMAYMIRAVVRETPIFGLATRPTRFVVLTEEGVETVREWLAEVGLGDADEHIRIVSMRAPVVQAVIKEMEWTDVVALAAGQARAFGAGVLIVDTLSKWARIPGDQENSAGVAAEAMTPLEFAAAGEPHLAVWVARHDRKSGGEVGDSARGSSAFGGSSDIIFQLTRANTPGHPNRRTLRGVGRYRDIPEEMTIELMDGEYIAIGSGGQVERADAKVNLLDILPASDSRAWTEAEILENVPGLKRTTWQRVRAELIADGLIDKVEGLGERRSAKGYRLAGASAQLTTAHLRIDPGQKSFSALEEPVKAHDPKSVVPQATAQGHGAWAVEQNYPTAQGTSLDGQQASEQQEPEEVENCWKCGVKMAAYDSELRPICTVHMEVAS